MKEPIKVKTEPLSKSAYARHRGCAPSAVTRAIKEGRISVDGTGRIDPTKADLEWSERSRARGDSSPRRPRESAALRSAATTAISAPPPAAAGAREPDKTGYSDARARREHTEAEMALIQLSKLRGGLVDRAQVERAAFTLSRTLRDRLLGLPVQIAPQLVAMTDPFEIEKKLRDAIREVLNECLGDLGVAH